MSEERLQKILEDMKYTIDFDKGMSKDLGEPISPEMKDQEYLYNEIIKLQQENKELKEQLKINNQAFNFNLKTIKKHNKENSILTKFEHWLEEYKKDEMFDYGNEQANNDFNEFCKIALDKLQELKEGKK